MLWNQFQVTGDDCPDGLELPGVDMLVSLRTSSVKLSEQTVFLASAGGLMKAWPAALRVQADAYLSFSGVPPMAFPQPLALSQSVSTLYEV